MICAEEIQIMLKQKGITQRELVKRSGLSESIISILIKQMPILLPHLIEALGKNPYILESENQGQKMAEALSKLAKLPAKQSIKDPDNWQREVRAERSLVGR
jgi:transcriptional regulator with XRE-family HTH domain